MLAIGYSGFYLSGNIVKTAKGQPCDIPFGFKRLKSYSRPYNGVQGVEAVKCDAKIEVMCDINPFKRRQRVELCSELYIVIDYDVELFSQLSDIKIVSVSLAREE